MLPPQDGRKRKSRDVDVRLRQIQERCSRPFLADLQNFRCRWNGISMER